MSEQRCEDLVKQGDKLFDRGALMSLLQEIAENFYPERADFTVVRNLGAEFADHLTTSYPIQARRDQSNIISTMLRPREKQWFRGTVSDYDNLDSAGKDFLEVATLTQKNAMYDGVSGFARATKETDDDLSAFGMGVLSCEMNWDKQALLYRNWHIRDVVWCEGHDGTVGHIQRKWRPYAKDVMKLFKGKVHDKVKRIAEKDPYKTIEVRHIVVMADDYEPPKGQRRWKKGWVSIYYDVENKFLLEEKNINNSFYIVPRWKTVSGSQYAYSPSTVTALSDARMMQAMMLVLLEAGQKAVDPPMIAVEEAIRSDVQLFAGGITMVEASYDEKMGEVLRPLVRDKSGIPLGIDLIQATKQAISDAFFLNKVGLPPLNGGMSPLEVSQRIQEYVMAALPLFEPLEPEYNNRLCQITFDVGMDNGLFGPIDEIPESLRGKEIDFRFENPLTEASEKAKGSQFLEIKGIIANAVDVDPSVAGILDYQVAVRDVLEGVGAPRKWFKSPEQMQQEKEASDQQAQTQQLLATMTQGAQTAQAIGDAGQSLQGLGGLGGQQV